jgi:membrane associated rhomboid family serine protease
VQVLLIRSQQLLAEAGYKFTRGDVDHWPDCMVEMAKDEWVQIIAPFDDTLLPRVQKAWLALRKERSVAPGLLVVGREAVNAPAVREFLRSCRGAVAYIDAVRGDFVRVGRAGLLKAPPRLLDHHHLDNLLRPDGSESYLRVDVQAVLAKDLAESAQVSEFMDKAHALAGKPRYRFTDVVLYACIALYAMMLLYGRSPTDPLTPTRDILLHYGALSGKLVAGGEVWRLITCSFLHVNLMHLIFNMVALVYFGRPLEIFQGVVRTALFYTFAVVTASLASIWWNPAGVSAGASGGLFGLLGVMLGMLARHRADIPPTIRNDLRRWLASILVFNAIWVFFGARMHLDNAAHLGGFVGGLAIALLLSRSPSRQTPLPKWSFVAAAVLIAATVAFGVLAIRRVLA